MNNLKVPYPQQNYILAEYSTLSISLSVRLREITTLKVKLAEAETEARYLEMDLANKQYLLDLAKKKDKIYTTKT